LLTCIFASQVSRQFSPHPFYHAAGLRFRRHIEAESGHVPHEKKE
jgi:chloride transporter, chloride channel family